MKKLVMVMCFALCASLAFAQTKGAAHRMASKSRTAAVTKQSKTDLPSAQKSYKASIFNRTKDAGEVIDTWEFDAENSGYTTGTITGIQTIYNSDGSSETMIPHTQSAGHSTWHRIPDAEDETAEEYGELTVDQGGYPVTYDWFYIIGRYAQTADNGFMVMTMAEQIADWGGSGAVGNFDAYVALNGVSTEGHAAVNLEFYQAYRAFNNDLNYIDYCVDGTTWYQYEINVQRVDVDVNDWTVGFKRVVLPAACGNVANLGLRFRWVCNNRAGGAYGYIWMLDDVSLVEAPTDGIELVNNKYYNGLYHQIPQGLDVPITWWASIQNIGVNSQAQVTLGMNHLNADSSQMDQIASMTFGPLANAQLQDTVLDGLGVESSWYNPGDPANINAPGAVFPTTDLGDNFIAASYGSTNIPTKVDDTILYIVNDLQDSPDGRGQFAVWALDNGVLTPNAYFVDGMVQDAEDETTWYLSTGIGDENPSYTKAGYDLWNKFVTGANIPDNWVIRGMQLVAATQYSATEATNTITMFPGAKIAATLMRDSVTDDGSLSFKSLETGAATYETTIDDYNYFEGDMVRINRYISRDTNINNRDTSIRVPNPNFKEYMMPGEYSVINIMFPEQPELRPNTSYRLGYELVNGFFAVAGQSSRYVHHDDSEPLDSLYWAYFSSDTLKDGSTNAMIKYGATFHPGNGWNQLIYDPDEGKIHPGSSSLPPMIRMLVGPKFDYPTFNVSVTCEGEGVDLAELQGSGVFYLSYSDSTSICGQTVTMTQGSTGSYTVGEAEPGYVVLEVYVDDVLVYKHGEAITNPNVSQRTSSNYDLVYYDFSEYSTDATIKYVFGIDEGPATYTIIANSNNPIWGTVSGSDQYESGEQAILRATPNPGYCFKQWDDGNTLNPRTITVTGDATYTAIFEECTQGINEASSNVSMSLYPNPANNNVKLSIAGVSGNVTCTVLDMSGRVVYSKTINAEEATTINVSNFAKGAYFVRVTNNEFTKVEKLVVR